jgi:hypothetical protein
VQLATVKAVAATLDRLKLDYTTWLPAHPPNPDRPLTKADVMKALGDLIGGLSDGGFAALVREGLLIGGWVAMWRPLEVFLYDWWPILGEARLFDRLGRMPVRIDYDDTVSEDAWRSDWPAVAKKAAS